MKSGATAWVFPGQGSQSVGMGRELCRKFAAAMEVFEAAEDMSGLPIRDACWQGPDELLGRTDVLQPALTAVSVGCVALLAHEGLAPDMVAGHSLGEYPALYAAGVLTLEDTLRLTIERGRLMAEASADAPGGMVAVKRLDVARVAGIIRDLGPDVEVVIANDNSPTQVVLSGTSEGLAAASACVAAHGGEAVTLRVSGAWHSPLRAKATAGLRDRLAAVAFAPARTPVYLGSVGASETDPERIRAAMLGQMTSPVHWRGVVEAMFADGASSFWEVGAGKVLRGLIRQTLPNFDAYELRGVDGPLALERPRATLDRAAS